MRVALISDIHGNTVALDAVLADLEHHSPDVIACLGDIAAGGPDPGGAIERIAALNCVTIQGNTDAGMVDMPAWWRDPIAIGLPEDAWPGMDITVWTADELTSTHRSYLSALPATSVVDLGAFGELLAFHGSPRSADDYISATTGPEELERFFEGSTAPLLAGGHTHVPLVRRFGTQTIVNPGSVGMPFATYGYAGGVKVLPHAAYALVTVSAGGVNIDLRQVSIDTALLRDRVLASGMPQAAWWLGLRVSTTDT